MKLEGYLRTLMVCVMVLWAVRLPAADVNSTGSVTGTAPTNDATTATLLQIQEQLHTTQLAIQQNQQSQQAAADTARNNTELLATQLQSLTQAITAQRQSDSETSHKALQTTLLAIGVFGLICLAVMLVMVYLQSRAFTQLTFISTQQQTLLNGGSAMQPLGAPGRVAVENANARLQEAVGQLKERLYRLENGLGYDLENGAETNGHALVKGPNGTPNGSLNGGTNGKANGQNGHGNTISNGHELEDEIADGSLNGASNGDLLAEGQRYLDDNAPVKALEMFDRFLAINPDHADGLLKKADALQKIGRNEEALAHYNKVIAKDGSLAVAHLQKGGLLNRLRRYDEALNCYEQALQAQERKRR